MADGAGNIVASTQTINCLFGARYIVPGTGMIPNNYMYVFDPHPGPCAVDRAGQARHHLDGAADRAARRQAALALGLPGGLRIFPSAMQAIINLIDHGMSAAGGGRGAAALDPGRSRVEVETGVPRGGCARRCAPGHASRVPAMSAAA